METNFQDFEENCVFNTELEEGLQDLVCRNFDLDEFGLKDNIRTSGLGFAKTLSDLKASGHLRKNSLMVKRLFNMCLQI